MANPLPEPKSAEVNGVPVPRFLYGTAWKESDTARLTRTALEVGFRGIDTANQRRHYDEAAVGEALATTLAPNGLRRTDLFLQTKFTFAAGQDHRIPYDRGAATGLQVEQSFASSLQHLGVDDVDSYILHGPSSRHGLGKDDYAAWEAMEGLHRRRQTRLLGISNVSLAQLQQLCATATVAPALVQNRCFASQGWDRGVRRLCQERGILYQGFSLLTANPEVLRHPLVRQIAARVGRTVAQVVFRFTLELGIIVLTGTTSREHMVQDLSVTDFELSAADVNALERLVG